MLVSALLALAVTAAPPRACPSEGATMVRATPEPALLLRPQDRRGDRGAQSLASLPPAKMQLTVMRSVGGCAIPTVVREQASGDGRFAKPR